MTSMTALKDSHQLFPENIPIFDIPGVLLLPRAHLPAHIRQSKYISLVKAALATDRYVGFVQPKAEQNSGQLFSSGCLGKITTFVDKTDGSYFIIVTGLIRFDIDFIDDFSQGYRRADVNYRRFFLDLCEYSEKISDRDDLINLLQSYFKDYNIQGNLDDIMQTTDENLVSLLAMICPFEPQEKQAILETHSLQERSQIIKTLMAMLSLKPNQKMWSTH